MTARGLHYAKPAMQVMSTNPLRAKESTVSKTDRKKNRATQVNHELLTHQNN